MAIKTAPAVPEDGTDTTTTAKQSFVECKKQQVKAAAKAKAAEMGSKAKTETTAMLWRNRRQLVPIKAAGTVAATGSTAALLAEHTELVDGAAAFGAAGLVGAGGAWALTKFKGKVPAEMKTRVKAGIAAGCLWCLGMPFTGVDAPAMWLGLGATTIGLSARWWQRIRPGYPTESAPPVQEETKPVTQPEPDLVGSGVLIERWDEFVASSGGALVNAEIGMPTSFTHGRTFPVQLVPGKQTLEEARAALPKIASGLRINREKLLFEAASEDDPSLVELRVVDASPIREAVFFDQPIYSDGFIGLGPYADGQGYASYQLYSESGLEGGYVVGSKGSGKSRVLEGIGITAIAETPTVLGYIDGQDGASSPLLWQHALWRGGPGDAEEMADALLAVMAERNRYNRYINTSGFTPTRERPGILIIVDECHRVFGTLGDRFRLIAQEGRKVGMGILAASQIADLTAFGNGGDALRSNLVSGNGIALRTMSNVQSNVFPGLKVDLSAMPKKPGYGYTVDNGDDTHRTAQFRARWLVTDEDKAKLAKKGIALPVGVRTAEDWLAEYAPGQQLDDISARAAGPVFLERHERAQRQQAALAAHFEGSTAYPSSTSTSGTAHPPVSSGSVLALPSLGGGTVTTDDGVEVSARQLTEREQDLMNLLADGGDWHTNDMAQHLGVSVQRVRQLVNRLEPQLVKIGSGVYRAKRL